jgi:1-acyl-sn-glycerol-3-phosphate acyltransferase
MTARMIIYGSSLSMGGFMFPPDLPPVKNWPLYCYRVFGKWFSFFIFGTGSVILGILIFPLMRLVLHPRDKFSKYGRRFISFTMRGYIRMMSFLGVVFLKVDNRKKYTALSSKIIIANHPSLLDVVMLLSLIPNADCVVTAYLKNNIISVVIRQMYILSSLEFNDLLRACTDSLHKGNCLIIFPEGTRTRRNGNISIKRGAARIALASGCEIVPVHIGGTDKFGLGKKDPWLGFNPTEPYVYNLTMADEIKPDTYRELYMPKAVRKLTRDISKVLFPDMDIKLTGKQHA